MMILVLLGTIVSLLASWAALEVNALGPVQFDFPLFDSSSISKLAFLFNSSIDTAEKVLKITDTNEIWCDTHVCRGQIFFHEPIKFHDHSRSSTYSFSTSFVFRLTIPANVRAGEGFVFLLIDDPFGNNRGGIGDYFGAFPSTGTPYTPTFAVEFDTLRNDEISDIDDDHIGVDINNPISSVQESCDSLNISLHEGQKLIAWIEYHDSIKKLQVRLANWTSVVIRPADPLIDMDLDLANVVEDTMYVGFSGMSYNAGVQETDIVSWFFHSELESPPPPPAPIQTSHNLTGFKINTSHNRTRSKEENTILGFCIGGGLVLVLAAGGCFWLCYRWPGGSALAAKEEAGDRKNKKSAARNVGDEKRRKFDQEGHVISDDDVEAATFGAGVFSPRLPRSSRSVEMVYTNNDAPDVTITTTNKKGRGEKEFMLERVKSARQLEADGVRAYAIKKGILDNGIVASSFRRRLQNFDVQTLGVPSKRGTGSTPTSSTMEREFVHLPEDETTGRADLPVPALEEVDEEEGTGGSPTIGAGEVKDREMLTKLQVPEGKEYLLRAADSPSFRDIITGDSRGGGDDSEEGISDIVYRIPASVENVARKSKSSSLWRSEAGALPKIRRHISPGGPITASAAAPPVSSVRVKRTESLYPWNSGPNREVEVVVRRSQAIQPRKRESVSTPERSPVSSPTWDSQRTPRKTPENSSTLRGTLMYTNTLYDSTPEESHDPSPCRRKSPQADLYMDENINIRPTPDNIHDRPPVRTDCGEEIVERIFDVPVTKEPKVDVDAEPIYYIPEYPDPVSQRDTTTRTPVTPTAVRTPAQSRGGSRLSSPKSSLAGTTTPSTAETSRSWSIDYTKDSERRRVKRRAHWR